MIYMYIFIFIIRWSRFRCQTWLVVDQREEWYVLLGNCLTRQVVAKQTTVLLPRIYKWPCLTSEPPPSVLSSFQLLNKITGTVEVSYVWWSIVISVACWTCSDLLWGQYNRQFSVCVLITPLHCQYGKTFGWSCIFCVSFSFDLQ